MAQMSSRHRYCDCSCYSSGYGPVRLTNQGWVCQAPGAWTPSNQPCCGQQGIRRGRNNNVGASSEAYWSRMRESGRLRKGGRIKTGGTRGRGQNNPKGNPIKK